MNKLDQFAALEKAATAGPWHAGEQGYLWQGDHVEYIVFGDDGDGAFRRDEDGDLTAAARNLAPAFLNLARTAQDCVDKLGYLERANLTDTERYVMRQLRAALAPLLAEVPDA